VSTVLIRQVTATVLAGFLAAASVAAARQEHAKQGGDARAGTAQASQRTKWWQDEKVKADLRLTSDQASRIDEIFQSFFVKMKDTADDLSRREEQLSKLISGNDVTEAQLLKEADQVEVLRGTLGKARTLMLFRMRRVLSAEQRSKLTEIVKAREQERRTGRLPERGQTY
jgi:Spy/CpxP family protein refolding chaperone